MVTYMVYYKKRGADKPWECQEIELWIENDYGLYKQLQAFKGNYAKKIQAGKFDKELGAKGLVNVVREAITTYNKRIGAHGVRMSLSAKDKALVAKSLFDDLWENDLRFIVAEVPPRPTRKFGGKVYKFKVRCTNEVDAKTEKYFAMKAGVNVRVIKSKDGFDIYTR